MEKMKKKKAEELYCLGIESSADDFSIGISAFSGRILANVIDAYVPSEGGIHPREAARHHAEVASKILNRALEESGVRPDNFALIAFTQGPGLGPCLRTGATVARALASYLKTPLVGVNHCVAHIEIGKLETQAKNPLTLYASGGNTIVAAFDSGRYRIFGETLDIALGNCLDVFAREAGLRQKPGLPFGAIIEKLAQGRKHLIRLPYTVKGMDVSLSGLLTAAVAILKKGESKLEDLCYSLQETAFSMVTEVTERALAHTSREEVLLTGGVAANKRLQKMIKSVAEEHDARFDVVPTEFAIDNGAMVAWTGVLAYTHGTATPIQKSQVRLKWRLDEAEVPWMR
jgi:N6-L-threonylcarbamoyladenine synthase/protein kinase Bud32